jgi:hypothetical protein
MPMIQGSLNHSGTLSLENEKVNILSDQFFQALGSFYIGASLSSKVSQGSRTTFFKRRKRYAGRASGHSAVF